MALVEFTHSTEDVSGMVDFDEVILGAGPVHRAVGISIFETDGTTILVHEAGEPAEGGPPNEDHPDYAVDDLDAAFADLANAGYDVVAEPASYDSGRAAFLRDPAGNLLELRSDWGNGDGVRHPGRWVPRSWSGARSNPTKMILRGAR